MTPALFFDLDGTLCHPIAPFPDIFFASLAPLLAAHPSAERGGLLAAWAAALERPGPATTASCLAWALAKCGVTTPDRALLTRYASALNTNWADAQRAAPDLWPALTALQARYTACQRSSAGTASRQSEGTGGTTGKYGELA